MKVKENECIEKKEYGWYISIEKNTDGAWGNHRGIKI